MSFKYVDNPFYNKKNDTFRVYLDTTSKINQQPIEHFKRETIVRNFLYTDSNILEVIKEKDVVVIEHIDYPVYKEIIDYQSTNQSLNVLIDKSKEKKRTTARKKNITQ